MGKPKKEKNLKFIKEKKINNKEYQDYLEERQFLIQSKREGANLFDKSILTISAGAFGISLTFYSQIAPKLKLGTEYFLIIAWIGLGLSMITILISMFTSRLACLRGIEILEEMYFSPERNENNKKEEKNLPAFWTKKLNIFSIVVFIAGIIFLAIFSIVNLINGGHCVK